jgi:NMD protein affecting ribosome stability and mRNA decay
MTTPKLYCEDCGTEIDEDDGGYCDDCVYTEDDEDGEDEE